MTNDEKKKLYAALAAPFPESCIQRTEGRLTGRGYDTSGIGYQHISNRLCEVVGVHLQAVAAAALLEHDSKALARLGGLMRVLTQVEEAVLEPVLRVAALGPHRRGLRGQWRGGHACTECSASGGHGMLRRRSSGQPLPNRGSAQ